MIEKTTLFKTTDGKTFKTEAGARRHQFKIQMKEMLDSKEISASGLQEKLEKAASRNLKIKALLLNHGKWEKFPKHLILEIFNKWDTLFNENLKTTYVMKYKWFGETKINLIATEEGPEFTAADLHCSAENPWDSFKVVEETILNEYTKEITLDYKYTEYEKALMKLDLGEKLSESEIRTFLHNSDEVYEEKGEDRRWSRSVTTVVKIDDKLYAILWEEGLTENQEDSFYNQPYEVELEQKPVTVMQTVIVPKK